MRFRAFLQKSTFPRQNRFFCEFPVFGRNFQFFGEKCTFPALGLQKTSQNVVFIKGFTQGPQKPHSGPKRALFGPESLKSRNSRFFSNMGLPLENGLCHLKKHQESIGCLSILETCRMVKFLEISLFYVKFHIFIENVKKSCCGICKNPVFRTRAARMRQAL